MLGTKNRNFRNLRMQSLRDGILRTGPRKAQFRIVNACNFDCAFCWNHSPFRLKPKPEEWKRQKIDTELFIDTVEDLAKLGCETILFSGGGEPFCHPDIMKLIKAVKKYGISLRIFSNLSLVKNINDLLRLGVNQVFVNINAATPETYEALHPNQPKQMFHIILEKVRRLSRSMTIDLVFIINRLNYSEIEKFIRLADEFRVGVRFNILLYDIRKNKILEKKLVEKLCIDRKIKKIIFNKLPYYEELLKKLNVRSNFDLIKMQLLKKGHYLPIKKFGCFQLGYLESHIGVDGKVYFCCMGGRDDYLTVGDLRQSTFREIWYSEKYEEVRKRMRRKKFLKICESCKEWLTVLSSRQFVSPPDFS